MGVFGNGYIRESIDIETSFVNEYRNFSRLSEAMDIVAENNIEVVVTEGFLSSVKELWKKFVGWLGEIFKRIKEGLKKIFNMRSHLDNFKYAEIQNAHIIKLKDYSNIQFDSKALFPVRDRDKFLTDLKNLKEGDKESYFIKNKEDLEKKEAEADEYLNSYVTIINNKMKIETEELGKVDNTNASSYKSKFDAAYKAAENYCNHLSGIIDSMKRNCNDSFIDDIDSGLIEMTHGKKAAAIFGNMIKRDVARGMKFAGELQKLSNYVTQNIIIPMTKEWNSFCRVKEDQKDLDAKEKSIKKDEEEKK